MPYGYMQDYSDELMRSSGNNPWYDPHSKYPNIAGGADAIRQLVNQMAMMKQMKEQEKREQEKELWNRKMEERRVAAEEARVLADLERAGKPTPAQEARQTRQKVALYKTMTKEWLPQQSSEFIETAKWPDERIELTPEEIKFAASKLGMNPKEANKWGENTKKLARTLFEKIATQKPTESTDYDKKRAQLDKDLAAGKINQQQYYQGLYGISGGTPSAASVAPSRRANIKRAEDIVKNLPDDPRKIAKDLVKQTGQRPHHETGFDLDMPIEYNSAKFNVEAGLGTPKDQDLITKYDQMLALFQGKIVNSVNATTGKPNLKFSDFMADPNFSELRKDKDIDLTYIQMLYEIYGK